MWRNENSVHLRALVSRGALAIAVLCGLSILVGRAGVPRQSSSMTQSAVAIRQLSLFLTSRSPMVVSGYEPDQVLGLGDTKLDAEERRHIIEAAISNLEQHYFDRDATERIADSLHAHEKNGNYEAIADGPALADLLTKQIREASQDMHLIVEYSANALPVGPPAPPPGAIERHHQALRQNNCTFEKVEVLPHNVGYLKLNSFPDTSVCRSTAVTAMARLNNTDAIIFDLRDNQGGYPEMVSLIASYLFDHPVDWYNPRDDSAQPSRTQSPVSGSRLADKPAYVLTSGRTISGAEQFSYNLKMLKRATLVGETTAGHAHIGSFYRLDDHFGMGIPERRPINPYGKADWEGIGVEPDVKVSSEGALETAKNLAQNNARQSTEKIP